MKKATDSVAADLRQAMQKEVERADAPAGDLAKVRAEFQANKRERPRPPAACIKVSRDRGRTAHAKNVQVAAGPQMTSAGGLQADRAPSGGVSS